MKAAFFLTVALCLSGTNSLDLSPLFPLDLIPIVGELWTLLASGVTVTMPTDNATSVSVGLVTVPLEFLCTAAPHDTCRLCYIDCIYAHNASYGYGCGGNAGGSECVCQYNTSVTVPSIDTQCGDYAANVLHLPAVNSAIDAALMTFLRARYQTILCNPALFPEPTCNVECTKNHWAKGGTCTGYVEGDNSLTFGYCVCNY